MRNRSCRSFWLSAVLTCAFALLQFPTMDGAVLSNGSTLSYGSSLNSDNGTYHLQHQLFGSKRVLTWDRQWCYFYEWNTAYDDPGPPVFGWTQQCYPPYSHVDQWGNGDTGNYLSMQTDGNLVLYNGSNTAIWEANTDGYGSSAFLSAQDDGNLVVYYNTNVPIWALY